jgi:hypothetical protein
VNDSLSSPHLDASERRDVEVRRTALEVIAADAGVAAKIWTYARLADDALGTEKMVAIYAVGLTVGVFVIGALGILLGFGAPSAGVVAAVVVAIAAFAVAMVVKDRDERRELLKQAAELPGFVASTGGADLSSVLTPPKIAKLTRLGEAVRDEYDGLMKQFEENLSLTSDPKSALSDEASRTLADLLASDQARPVPHH